MVCRALTITTLAVAALLVAVAPAFAAGGGDGNATHATSSILPFTGLDVGLVGVTAGVLGVIGLAVARLIRVSEQSD